MKKKAIILQIEMRYHVDEDLAVECYERDIEHFTAMGQAFNSWGVITGEPREPVEFNFRHAIGAVGTDEEE